MVPDRSQLCGSERLYQAAVSLFREQGYEETTVDQITRRAGLAKGTFFNYFTTKDAVLRYMGERAIGRLGNISVAGGSASAVGNLKRFLVALANSLEQDRDLVRLIFNKGIAVPELLAGNAGYDGRNTRTRSTRCWTPMPWPWPWMRCTCNSWCSGAKPRPPIRWPSASPAWWTC